VGAEPTLQALEESDKIVFGIFDLSPAVLKTPSEGKMAFATVLQGYLPIVFLTKCVRYGLLPANDVILAGPGSPPRRTPPR